AFGVPVGAPGSQTYPRSISDGAGGLLVAWNDHQQVFIQRILANGSHAPGWPESGVPVAVSTTPQSVDGLGDDSAEGAFVVLTSYGDQVRCYAQPVLGSGAIAPEWPAEGIPLVNLPNPASQQRPVIARTGDGAAMVAWEDSRDLSLPHIYAQELA